MAVKTIAALFTMRAGGEEVYLGEGGGEGDRGGDLFLRVTIIVGMIPSSRRRSVLTVHLKCFLAVAHEGGAGGAKQTSFQCLILMVCI